MNKTLNKLSLVAVAVSCAMPTGYRRAGFSLKKGDNSLDVNKDQFDALDADENLSVTLKNADSSRSDIDTHVKSEHILSANIEQLKDDNTLLKSKVADLTALCTIQEADIKELEEQLATALLAAQPSKVNVGEIGKVAEPIELDVSSAPEELHHFITVIHDLNEEAPLTKKPNCDLLTITVDDNSVTPTAAERDEAWAWYQANVVVTTDAAQAEAEA
jgi:Mu-like prophage FluMu N-terminal domain